MVASLAASAVLTVPRWATPRIVATMQASAYLQDLTEADVTGDGISDVIVTRLHPDHPERAPIAILAGNGKGEFHDVTSTAIEGSLPGLLWPRHTVVADFNGDGRADVFFADTGFDQFPFAGTTQTLLLSTPSGKLVDASANLPQDATYTHTAAAADVNGDGAVDLYEGNICCGSAGPRVLLNDGHGVFAPLSGALPADMLDPFGDVKYTRSTFADVNDDGAPDLVLAGEGDTPDGVLLNDGTGHFHRLDGALPPKPFGGQAEGLAIAPTDLNADGKVDLILGFTHTSPFYVGRWIQIAINNGNGTFRDETVARLPPQTDEGLAWPYAILVADVNHDGKPDFGVTCFSQPGALTALFLNRGNGTFRQLGTPVPEAQFVFVDANRDGRVDIVDGSPSGGVEQFRLIAQLAPPKPKRKRHHP
jgi:hypothetical protein